MESQEVEPINYGELRSKMNDLNRQRVEILNSRGFGNLVLPLEKRDKVDALFDEMVQLAMNTFTRGGDMEEILRNVSFFGLGCEFADNVYDSSNFSKTIAIKLAEMVRPSKKDAQGGEIQAVTDETGELAKKIS